MLCHGLALVQSKLNVPTSSYSTCSSGDWALAISENNKNSIVCNGGRKRMKH